MAVRPWENRFVDINLKDGVMVHGNGLAEAKTTTKIQLKSTGKKPVPSSGISNQKMGPSYSDGSGSSSNKSTSMQATSATLSGKAKPKLSLEEPVEEATSKPSGLGSHSYSNPKERLAEPDIHARKRLSLPSSGESSALTCSI